ncbi:MAG: divalent-cation tolerance protein CutA [Candidatus Poseidoniaceae archaeon]|nr:divalent-cation tolerance protein CutA [Candidatus Poseidoniaceae archaeon]
MSCDVLLIQTTLPGDWMEALVGEFELNLLDAGAACVQHHKVQSMYRWEGDVHSESEWRLLIKLSSPALEAVTTRLRQQHPYDVPEVLSWSVDSNQEYGEWVSSAFTGVEKHS